MDEPFGAVDEITRKGLQDELKRIHEQEEMTIIFVTHDIGEALHMGTQVLVLREGEVVQFAAPDELRAHPADDYVRELMGKHA
jgi:osmoprotectant transport system ATP-binding protein